MAECAGVEMSRPTFDHPTVQVARAHLEAQGVFVSDEIADALCALFSPASDAQSAERHVILSTELAQVALTTLEGQDPQTVKYAPIMLVSQACTVRALAELLGGGDAV